MTPAKLKHVDENTPIGTVVLVVEDDQTITITATRSKPWKLGHGQLVVLLVGRTGGYMVERCFLEHAPGIATWRCIECGHEAIARQQQIDGRTIQVIACPQCSGGAHESSDCEVNP